MLTLKKKMKQSESENVVAMTTTAESLIDMLVNEYYFHRHIDHFSLPLHILASPKKAASTMRKLNLGNNASPIMGPSKQKKLLMQKAMESDKTLIPPGGESANEISDVPETNISKGIASNKNQAPVHNEKECASPSKIAAQIEYLKARYASR